MSARSRWQSHNSYGTSIADLSRIVRTAPEVKRCLMKRLFEYVVAEDQTIDRGYLDHLTRQFEEEAAVNSSDAMKNAIVRILQSEAYNRSAMPIRSNATTRRPARSQATDRRAAWRSSCQKNCGAVPLRRRRGPMARTGSMSALGSMAPDGSNRTFRHLDASMLQLSAHESFARIVERMSTYDAQRADAEGQDDAQRRAPGAFPVGAGGTGSSIAAGGAMIRALAIVAHLCLRSASAARRRRRRSSRAGRRSPGSSPPASRPKDEPLDLDDFLPAEDMDDLLGTWSTVRHRAPLPQRRAQCAEPDDLARHACPALPKRSGQSCITPSGSSFIRSSSPTLRQLCRLARAGCEGRRRAA